VIIENAQKLLRRDRKEPPGMHTTIALVRVQKVLRRLLIYLSKLDEFKHFDTALARLAFREKGMRPFHPCRDFALRHARFFAGRDQLLEKSVIDSLMGRSSPLARDSSLRLLLLLHLSSLGNA
jgi:hypothetical protein